MNMFLKAGALALAIGFTTAGAADAAGLKALFLGGEDLGTVNLARADILTGDARFDLAGSASMNISSGTPTLSYLQQFDSVLVWTNQFPNDTTALSNVLADYVDAGGGVVISTFWGQEVDNISGAPGRLNATGYNPLTNGTFDAYTSHTLGTFNAADPLMAGVNTLASSTYNADYLAGLDAGATLVAQWNDGRPLVAINAARNVAAVTLFPSVATFGHATGDYRQLFGNALAVTAAGRSISAAPEPASWALMLVGFGGLGATLRAGRRRVMA